MNICTFLIKFFALLQNTIENESLMYIDGGCFYLFSIVCSTFVAGFRVSAIPKDIVDKRNGV